MGWFSRDKEDEEDAFSDFGAFEDDFWQGWHVDVDPVRDEAEYDAEKIVLEPAEDDVTVDLANTSNLKDGLRGFIVDEGDRVKISPDNQNSFFSTFYLKVAEIKPEGPADVKSDTIIRLRTYSVDENGVPKKAIFTVEELPGLEEWGSVDSIEDIQRLAQSVNVGKYSDDDRTVYLCDPYYLEMN